MAQSKVMTLERQQQYDEKIKEYIDAAVEGASNSGSVTSDTGWVDLGSNAGQGLAFYRKIGSMVTIRVDMSAGAYLYGSDWCGIGLGTLPENCRPSTTVCIPAWEQYTSDGSLVVFKITTAGAISAKIANGTDSSSTSAEGCRVSFLTDEISNVTTYLDADEVSY